MIVAALWLVFLIGPRSVGFPQRSQNARRLLQSPRGVGTHGFIGFNFQKYPEKRVLRKSTIL